jgi:hypothetical protein
MSRRSALAELSVVTSEQWGMVTAAQARRAGVSRVDLNRLIGDGVMERIDEADGVYRLTGSPPDPELDGLRAAWLQLGRDRSWEERVRAADAVVSHRSAAHARGLGDLIPSAHDFYVDRRHRLVRPDLVLHVRGGMAIEWDTAGGLPVCRVEQIIADLLMDHEDESAVATVCQDAVRDGLTSGEKLHRTLTGIAGKLTSPVEALLDRLLTSRRIS